jgi:hypothetical protein
MAREVEGNHHDLVTWFLALTLIFRGPPNANCRSCNFTFGGYGYGKEPKSASRILILPYIEAGRRADGLAWAK